jgi:AcrR family transcriptional regulator
MVSQSAGLDRTSRERLLAAAAVEFSARGFDGAKVDRIALRARVNKAMLYYHFRNKAALYRAILHDLFQSLAAAVRAAEDAGGSPEDRLRRYVGTVAAQTSARPHFPAFWLREMAEGGRHLDASIARDLAAILRVLSAILREGREQGVFRDVHPVVAQVGIVAPLLLFAASAPVRERFQHALPENLAAVARRDVIDHVERSALAALAERRPPTAGAVRQKSSSPHAPRPRR